MWGPWRRQASVVVHVGSAAGLLVESSWTRDPAHVPQIGGWILSMYHQGSPRRLELLFPPHFSSLVKEHFRYLIQYPSRNENACKSNVQYFKKYLKIFPILAVIFFPDTSQYSYYNHNVPYILSFILRQYLISFALWLLHNRDHQPTAIKPKLRVFYQVSAASNAPEVNGSGLWCNFRYESLKILEVTSDNTHVHTEGAFGKLISSHQLCWKETKAGRLLSV